MKDSRQETLARDDALLVALPACGQVNQDIDRLLDSVLLWALEFALQDGNKLVADPLENVFDVHCGVGVLGASQITEQI